MPFSDFPLAESILEATFSLGFEEPTEVQQRTMNEALAGRDIIGCSQTGTGKTAAFLIPIIDGLLESKKAAKFRPKALVVSPTRELARQVLDHFEALAQFTELKGTVVTGGMPIGKEELAFQDGVELLVATPGRLLDHLSRGGLKLTDVSTLVIDEADRLFDAGFLPDIHRIVDRLPSRLQTMLVSATLPPEVDRFAREILNKPVRIQVGLIAPASSIEETFWPAPESQKTDLLRLILQEEADSLDKVLVFVKTREKARSLAGELAEATGLAVEQLHGELTQQQRIDALKTYRHGACQILIATDLASRGLDIEGVSHVINYHVPQDPDDYIHRVGRTGRVDRTGKAMTLIDPEELHHAANIEYMVRRPIKYRRMEGFAYDIPESTAPISPKSKGFKGKSFREPKADGGKENPFTKTGKLRKRFQEEEDQPPRRQSKRRNMRKILNKKLPHQRKKR